MGEDVDVFDGEAKRMATVAFAQSPSVPSVYLSKVVPIGGPIQVSDLIYSSEFQAGQSITVNINGAEIAGSPIPFTTSHINTLVLVGNAIQAETEVAIAVAPGADTLTIGLIGQDAGVSFSASSTVTGPGVLPTAVHEITQSSVGPLSSTDLDSIAENNNDWFGYTHVFHNPADNLTASSWVAANKKYGFFRTYDSTGIDVGALNSSYSCGWYSDPILQGTIGDCVESAVGSALLSRTPGSYTAAFKSLELITPTKPTDEDALRTNKCNQYSEINQRAITWDGVTSNLGFIDTYIGVLYLEARISEDVFGYIASQNKVPYTNPGIDGIVSQVQSRLDQSVIDGYLTNDPAPIATAPRVTEISSTDKSNRLLPNVIFSATTAGAIHTVQINGTLIA